MASLYFTKYFTQTGYDQLLLCYYCFTFIGFLQILFSKTTLDSIDSQLGLSGLHCVYFLVNLSKFLGFVLYDSHINNYLHNSFHPFSYFMKINKQSKYHLDQLKPAVWFLKYKLSIPHF